MKLQPHNIKLENFDDCWNLGDPVVIESRLQELLPQTEALTDKSTYLQILSQIALAQALQKKIDTAHQTLDCAETLLAPEHNLARARILLERGRVFQQAEQIPQARSFFEQSFELSNQHEFSYHTINAAHMIAIVASTPEEKIEWNERAIQMAESTSDARAKIWLGSLYNNIGQNYLEARRPEQALTAFQKALECRITEGYAPNIRVAKWAVARALRVLNRSNEALALLHALVQEYDAMIKSKEIDMPAEMFTLARGWVYEELAEIYYGAAKMFARLAYEDLSNNEMFKKIEPLRLERLKKIQE